METIKVMLDPGAYPPTRAHKDDAGLDIYSPIGVEIKAHNSVVIDTGCHILIPSGYVGVLKSKSGLNVKHGLTGDGTIDAGYVGSIKVKLYNNSNNDYVVEQGHKIIQLVVLPIETPEVELVKSMPCTDRGENGFGSSGK